MDNKNNSIFKLGPNNSVDVLAIILTVFALLIVAADGSMTRIGDFSYRLPVMMAIGAVGGYLIFDITDEIKQKWWWQWAVVAAAAFMIACIGQMAAGFDLVTPAAEGQSMDVQRLAAVGCVLFLILVIYAVSGSLKAGVISTGVVVFVFGIIEYFVKLYRGDSFFIGDILAFGTAREVVSGYRLTMHGGIFLAVFVLLGVIALALLLPKREGFDKPALFRRGAALVAALVAVFAFMNADIERYYDSWDTTRNQYITAFFLNMKMLNLPPPSNYSPEEVEKIVTAKQKKQNTSAKVWKRNVTDEFGNITEVSSSKQPTVIAIMNESFSDIGVLGKFKTNVDYMPFVRGMADNTVKGRLYMDVLGGGTCNSEYSFLTGNTTAFVPENMRPFQMFVDKNTWSLAKNFKSLGYETHAMHPAPGGNWNRNTVYPNLGFEHTYFGDELFKEYAVLTREFAADSCTYHKIIDLYEKRGNKPQFIFDVTIANHGGYATGATGDLEQVRVENSGKDTSEVNEYLTLIKKSDKEIQDLVAYFDAQDDPVIIVFFGDHQPAPFGEFYEEIKGKPVSEWTPEETQKMYMTPYFIWSNYDIPEETRDMSVNFLTQKVLSVAGAPMTAYDQYEAELCKQYPVIDIKGVKDAKGNYHTLKDADSQIEAVKDFHKVVYNNIFDRHHHLTELFTLPEKKESGK